MKEYPFKLKELLEKNCVEFEEYRKGFLYYRIRYNHPERDHEEVTPTHTIDTDYTSVYQFPVPIEDIGDATFKHRDKAILFMRYIRKAMEEDTFELIEKRGFKSHIYGWDVRNEVLNLQRLDVIAEQPKIGLSIGNVAGVTKVNFD